MNAPRVVDLDRRRIGAGGFRLPLEQPAAAATVSATEDVTLSGLLALQADAADPPRDRTARAHGRALLAGLAAWQRELLGAPNPQTLHRLASLLAAQPEADDPSLRAAIAAITLRCQVELARAEAS